MDLTPLSGRYILKPESPVRCLNLTVHSDGIITKSDSRITFTLVPLNISKGVTVERKNLTYIIRDSDSEFQLCTGKALVRSTFYVKSFSKSFP